MRLLHVTTVPLSLSFLRGQIAYMQARGIEVHLVSSPGARPPALHEAEDVPVHLITMIRAIDPLRDLLACGALYRTIRRLRPTIVHAHTPKAGMLAMLAATCAGVPLRIYHMRGLALCGASGARRMLLSSAEWITCVLAHRVIAVSHSLRDTAIQYRISPPRKIRVLHHGSGQGVDAEGRFNPARLPSSVHGQKRGRLGIPATARVIGFVGRMVPDKGIGDLVRIWSRLRREYPDLHLLMVGPFEREHPLRPEIAQALRRDARVHLPGLDWNTPEWYAAMDVVVLPSYREGFPNVALEAAAMELPIVASRVVGSTDAVRDGETGRLVPSGDLDALCAAVRTYLDSPDLRASHGRAARARVLQQFRPVDVWAEIYREYLTLLQSGSRRARFHTTLRRRVARAASLAWPQGGG